MFVLSWTVVLKPAICNPVFEFPVAAPCAGKVLQVFCREGSQVSSGQDLIVLEAA
jgi:biotin carboxyl carrier protein